VSVLVVCALSLANGCSEVVVVVALVSGCELRLDRTSAPPIVAPSSAAASATAAIIFELDVIIDVAPY
jgi:hypothetical protein